MICLAELAPGVGVAKVALGLGVGVLPEEPVAVGVIVGRPVAVANPVGVANPVAVGVACTVALGVVDGMAINWPLQVIADGLLLLPL